MNTTYISILGFAVVLLANCGPSATFDETQPSGGSIEKSFSKKYQGKYLSKDSSSTLTISNNFITSEYQEFIETPIQDLDSNYKIIGDTLLNLTSNSKDLITSRNDSSVFSTHIQIDTIFKIEPAAVLKKYKGHYFLNKEYGENKKWQVNKLSLEKNVLTYSSIIGEEDINKLNDITNTAKDTTAAVVNYSLNKKQFKKFLQSDGFSVVDTFFRINDKSLPM